MAITRDEVDERITAAELTRTRGAVSCGVGAVLFAAAIGAFGFAEATEIESWVRQTVLTVIAIVVSGGLLFYAIGRSERRALARRQDETEAAYARGFADGIEHATRAGTRRPMRMVPPQDT